MASSPRRHILNCRAAQFSSISRPKLSCYSILTGQIEKFSQADKLAAPKRDRGADFYLISSAFICG
jgi:hypothetical protein